VAPTGATRNDLDWEIYPRGLEVAVLKLATLGVPVVVTENGVADAADRLRPRALVESLLHLARAIARGVRVEGYFHWSLTDNFEWADGYRGRFGLYQVDFSDPERPRTRTKSAAHYARIAGAHAIDDETWRAATGELEVPLALR
jgi:beta-glucosidase/6-phospho-beta-glucosidase/beta-galactosidase